MKQSKGLAGGNLRHLDSSEDADSGISQTVWYRPSWDAPSTWWHDVRVNRSCDASLPAHGWMIQGAALAGRDRCVVRIHRCFGKNSSAYLI